MDTGRRIGSGSGRWWRRLLRSSRGVAQSAMVGGLAAAALAVTTGLVVAAPGVGSAVADLWTCSLAGGPDSCTDADQGGKRGRLLAENDTVGPPGYASAAYNEAITTPARHPTVPANSGAGGKWQPLPGLPGVPMDWCSGALPYDGTPFGDNTVSFCVDGDGNLQSCTSQWHYSFWTGAARDDRCGNMQVPLRALRCVADGVHPRGLLCTLSPVYDDSGRFFHCTPEAGQLAGYATCTDSNHDADAHLADPVACAVTADPTGSTPCLGSNGTLYNCSYDGSFECADGGRNIDPRTTSLSNCKNTPGSVPGTSVQCTWTGAQNGCAVAGSGTAGGCEGYVTAVQCAVSPADGVYNHCQDLGVVSNEPTDGYGQFCVKTDAKGACVQTQAIPLTASPGPPEATYDTGLGADYTVPAGLPPMIQIPDGHGGTTTTDYAGAKAYCTTDPAGCSTLLDTATAGVQSSVTDLLIRVGACTTAADCNRQLAILIAPAGLANKGRCLQAIGDCIPRLPARLRLSTSAKGLLTIAAFVAGATGVQFTGADIIGSLTTGGGINIKKIAAVGAFAAFTGGAVLSTVAWLTARNAKKLADEEAAAGGGGGGGGGGPGGGGPDGGPGPQAAQLQLAASAQTTLNAILADPQMLAQLQAALAQPVNPQGAAAAEQAGVNLPMANLAGAAQQAAEIQPANEQQVEEDVETGGGAGVCPADQGGGGGGPADQQVFVQVAFEVLGADCG